MIRSLVALIVLLGLCPGGRALAQSAEFVPSIDSVEIKSGVWMLRPNSRVGNSTVVALIDGSRAALLDFGMASTAALLRDWLRQRGVEEVVFAASSHHHPDHTDGLAALARWTKPTFLTTSRQYERLYPPASEPVPWPGLAAIGLPVLTIEGTAIFHLGTHSLRLDPVPSGRSHTDGDLMFDIDHGAVRYIGDHLFVDRYPVVDTGGGSELGGYLSTVDCVVKSSTPDTVIVPGHALFSPKPLAAASSLQLAAWRARLLDSIAEIRSMKRAGLDVEAAKVKGLPARFAGLVEKPSFVRESRWIETVYRAIEAGQDLSGGCAVSPGGR